MVVVGMSSIPLKVIKKRHVYELKVLQGYQKTLDPRGVQTFERGKNQRKQGNL
jgi:hypothetical protein